MYKKIIHIIGFLLFFSFILNSNAEESITVSTYYPSPSGVYKTLRLMPRPLPPASGKPGELCYIDGTDPAYSEGVYAYKKDTGKWEPALAGTADSKAPLINSTHTEGDCIAAGGQPVPTDTGLKQCRFPFENCPTGWTQYKYYSACGEVRCSDDYYLALHASDPATYPLDPAHPVDVRLPVKDWSNKSYKWENPGLHTSQVLTFDCPVRTVYYSSGSYFNHCACSASYVKEIYSLPSKPIKIRGRRTQIGCY